MPGISTLADLDAVRDAGATTVRVATHCTEADCAEQPIRHARDHGMRVMSFLMMSHKLEPAALAKQAAKLDSYGAQVIYVVDPAKRAAAKYGVPVRELLLEQGRREVIGGQEDMTIDVAAELSRRVGSA